MPSISSAAPPSTSASAIMSVCLWTLPAAAISYVMMPPGFALQGESAAISVRLAPSGLDVRTAKPPYGSWPPCSKWVGSGTVYIILFCAGEYRSPEEPLTWTRMSVPFNSAAVKLSRISLTTSAAKKPYSAAVIWPLPQNSFPTSKAAILTPFSLARRIASEIYAIRSAK